MDLPTFNRSVESFFKILPEDVESLQDLSQFRPVDMSFSELLSRGWHRLRIISATDHHIPAGHMVELVVETIHGETTEIVLWASARRWQGDFYLPWNRWEFKTPTVEGNSEVNFIETETMRARTIARACGVGFSYPTDSSVLIGKEFSGYVSSRMDRASLEASDMNQKIPVEFENIITDARPVKDISDTDRDRIIKEDKTSFNMNSNTSDGQHLMRFERVVNRRDLFLRDSILFKSTDGSKQQWLPMFMTTGTIHGGWTWEHKNQWEMLCEAFDLEPTSIPDYSPMQGKPVLVTVKNRRVIRLDKANPSTAFDVEYPHQS